MYKRQDTIKGVPIYSLCFIFTFVLTTAYGSETITLTTPITPTTQTGSTVDGTGTSTTATTTIAHPYLQRPNVSTCDEGVLSQDAKDRALLHLNYIRSLHGLKPVTYEPADDILVQRAALIIVANAALNHNPVPANHCFSTEGLTGSEKGNLFISGGTPVGSDVERYINAWLIDKNVDSLGHRRWVIDPFLKSVALGVVDGDPRVPFGLKPVVGAVLKILNDADQDNADLPAEFVAYPYKEYPTSLFDKEWFLSFSVFTDRTSRFGGNKTVDFTGATVTVKSGQGPIPVNSVTFNNNGAGIANIIQWKAKGLTDGVTYTVEIANVKVNDQLRSYTYDFTLK